MTLHEFLNELRRLHCIDGDRVPELPPHRQAAFVRDPVNFLMRADDATAQAVWRAMERDREAQVVARAKRIAAQMTGKQIDLVDMVHNIVGMPRK